MPLLPRALARLLSDQSEMGHAKAGPEPGPGERGAGPSSEGGEEQFVEGGLGGGGSDDVPATTGGASSSAGGGAGAKRDVVQLWRRLNEEGRTRYTHLSHAHARKHSLTHVRTHAHARTHTHTRAVASPPLRRSCPARRPPLHAPPRSTPPPPPPPARGSASRDRCAAGFERSCPGTTCAPLRYQT